MIFKTNFIIANRRMTQEVILATLKTIDSHIMDLLKLEVMDKWHKIHRTRMKHVQDMELMVRFHYKSSIVSNSHLISTQTLLIRKATIVNLDTIKSTYRDVIIM